MAGAARFVEIESKPSRMINWQLLKTPAGIQTAPSAAQLSQRLRDVRFVQTYFDFADVSWCKSIMVQCWDVGSENDDPILQLYGWNDHGPGLHIGTITSTIGDVTSQDRNDGNPGWHTDTRLHVSIQRAFNPDTDYLACDNYVVTDDNTTQFIVDTAGTPINYEAHKALWVPGATAAGGAAPEADYPSYFVVDLERLNIKYLCLACTDLDSATLVGAIFKVLCPR